MEETIKEEELEKVFVEEIIQKEPGKLQSFWQDERGVGVIEIVLILVILIGLVLVFKEQITAIINNAFATISGDAGKILN